MPAESAVRILQDLYNPFATDRIEAPIVQLGRVTDPGRAIGMLVVPLLDYVFRGPRSSVNTDTQEEKHHVVLLI